jgi:Uma2 family endonuclease
MTTLMQTETPIDTQPKVSYEEFLEWMDDERHAEWVDGEIIEMSPVSNQHQNVAGFLIALLRIYVEERHLGEVRNESYQMKPALHLPGRAPDFFFVANAHLDRLKNTYLEGPADLVVEIISPESRARDRGDKFFEYEAAGIPEYWLIDPIREQAEFYQLGADGIYRPASLDEQGRYHSVVLPASGCKKAGFGKRPCPRCSPY